jgi:hypothetical protein
MREPFYSGTKLTIKSDGIRLKKRDLFLKYSEISSISIKKARLSKAWLGFIILGLILDAILIYLLFYFVVNIYNLQSQHNAHLHYSRRGPGMVIGVFVALPVIITYRVMSYFTRPVMLIIRWDNGEFRTKFSELKISVEGLKSYLHGKVEVN